ncbi:PilZ domain-containing protein [Alishewanella sp. 16-MA]|uniref:PilZ domain-containing protein n=1 Tax=Alishewanella maricola TaxID=2795740 RepID=A0ABS8C737_9ALTE|nr:PilZ domain-containing protein [Alishewanella maricola]MCB5227940.1 PilZ domain-containing protein [Alishewanella maricola]
MTATDFKEQSGIIERMKGLINSPEFEQTFASLSASLPKSKQFLLKMELKRLAQPCNYYIDLRGHVDGDVKPFVYLGKTHHLDDTARQIFENGVNDYGQYTIGVYEEVMNADNNFRVRHRKETEERVRNALAQRRNGLQLPDSTNTQENTEPEEETNNPNKLVQFGYYISRCEERMNYGIEVEVRHADQRFSAMTTDLSVGGCKLKIPAGRQIVVGDTLNLALRGLEKEFTLNLPKGLTYQVLEVDEQDKYNYLRLKRLNPEQEGSFNQFLQSFIHGNKRRYKVNLDNTTDAVITKGYEQYYLPRINTLPVYLSVVDGQVSSRFCLTSDYNKSVWHYFLDEQQLSVLSHVLSAKRLKLLLSQTSTERSSILYCFTHAAKGKLYFYAATDLELAESTALREMFFGFGAGKPSWRVFHLNLLKTHVSQSINEFAIPGAVNTQKPFPLIAGMLKDMHYIAALTEISSAEHRRYYSAYTYQTDKLAALNKFGLSKALQAKPCEAIAIHYINLRAESRYLYKTTVLVRNKPEQTPISSFSRDFSTGGLQIEFSQPVDFQKGDILLFELPDLQKITNKHQLSGLPYEVMAVSKSRTIMNLKIAQTDYHVGKAFFQQLIQSNRSKLTVAEETPKYPGLSDALRNMYVKTLNNFAVFIHRKGLRHDVNVLGRGAQPNAIHKLLQLSQQSSKSLDFSLLTKEHVLTQEVAHFLKQMKRHDPSKQFELYIRVTPLDNGQLEFSSHYDFEFKQAEDLQIFILDAIEHHVLFSFKLYVSRTGKLDSEYIAKEIGYISVYAIHKAKTLEEELWHVEGVADGVETSAEIVARYNAAACTAQQQARMAILARDK